MPSNPESSRFSAFSTARAAGITACALLLAVLSAGTQAALSEPHAVFFGDVIVNNQQLQSSDSQYTIVVKQNGTVLTSFQMGDEPSGLSNKYVVRLPMDSVGTRAPGTARTGDSVEFYASSIEGEEWLASATVGGRGTITQLKLGMVDIDGDAVDDAIDNCPLHVNATQLDTDSDGKGDVCDDFPTNSAETTDSDSDGMGDNFESTNGFNPLDPSDAGLDADNDGINNLAEYIAGTNPRNVAPPTPVAQDVPLPLWSLVLLAVVLGNLGGLGRKQAKGRT